MIWKACLIWGKNNEMSGKDKDGTIETLERQLVQAGIKGKVMQADMEITKKKHNTNKKKHKT